MTHLRGAGNCATSHNEPAADNGHSGGCAGAGPSVVVPGAVRCPNPVR